MSISTITV